MDGGRAERGRVEGSFFDHYRAALQLVRQYRERVYPNSHQREGLLDGLEGGLHGSLLGHVWDKGSTNGVLKGYGCVIFNMVNAQVSISMSRSALSRAAVCCLGG